MHRFDRAKFDDLAARRSAARKAVARLLQIEAGAEGSTIAQSQTAIKDIARYERHLIRLVAGELT